MVLYLNQFLEFLKSELPVICSDKDLVEHLPNIFKNPCALTRMRSRKQAPPHFSIHPHIYYLRDDVISWLRERYQSEELSNEKLKQSYNTNKENACCTK